MTSSRRFPNDPAAVRAARKFAVNELSGYEPELLEIIELLVSELAGNCVRHTESNFVVRIGTDPHRIRVSVSDRGSGRPVAQALDPDAVAGRGLALVEMLSSSWGVRRNRSLTRGKAVWFVLELEDEQAHSQVVA
jgi:serine/threonine-protein kinase RsbW